MSVSNETLNQKLDDLTGEFRDFRNERRGALEKVIKDVGELQVTQGKQGERISNMNIFQTALSLIIGAVAAYLGVSKGK